MAKRVKKKVIDVDKQEKNEESAESILQMMLARKPQIRSKTLLNYYEAHNECP